MRDILYEDIAKHLGKSLSTIRGWKVNFPKLLELVKIGYFCTINNLDIDSIKRLIAFKEELADIVFEAKSGMTMDTKTFKKHFTTTLDKKYCIDNKSGKKFAFKVLDMFPDTIQIIDPEDLENEKCMQ